MPDLKISAATLNPAPAGTDNFATDKAGVDFRTTLDQIKAYAAAGAGDVFKVGTPANDQVGVWTGDGTIEGASLLRFGGAGLQVDHDILIGNPATTGLYFAMAATPMVRNIAATSLVPSLIPNKADTNSGVGLHTFDAPSMVAGGVEAQRWAELNGGVVQVPHGNTAITAFATGGQASATQLNDSYNVITTVATTGDSVKLPPVFGLYSIVHVKNDGVNAADVFPASGDDLGAGVDTAVSLAAGTSLSFIATSESTVGTPTWTQLLVPPSSGPAITGTPAFKEVAFWTPDGTAIGGDSNLEWNTVQLLISSAGGSYNTGVVGGGQLRNIAADVAPTLIPRNDRLDVGWGSASGSDNMRLILDSDISCFWFHTGAADNSVQWSWGSLPNVTASTTQTQGNGLLNGNRFTRVGTVANQDDVVTLPNVGTGLQMVIMNTGANRLQIFPSSGDQIVGNAVDASITLNPDESIILHTLGTTLWMIIGKTEDPIPAAVFPEYLFYADQMDNPVNSDWDINALAPVAADSNNAALSVRLFDDASAEAAGLAFKLPSGATSFTLELVSRAETAPGAAKVVKPSIEVRTIGDNAAVPSPPWTSLNLVDIDIPTNENFQYDTQAITFASLSLTAGDYVQMQIARNPTHPNDDLVGDWVLLSVLVSFT